MREHEKATKSATVRLTGLTALTDRLDRLRSKMQQNKIEK